MVNYRRVLVGYLHLFNFKVIPIGSTPEVNCVAKPGYFHFYWLIANITHPDIEGNSLASESVCVCASEKNHRNWRRPSWVLTTFMEA